MNDPGKRATGQRWGTGSQPAVAVCLVALMLAGCSPAENHEAPPPEEIGKAAIEDVHESAEIRAQRDKFQKALEGNLPEKASAALEKLKALGGEISEEEGKRLAAVQKELADAEAGFNQAVKSNDLEATRSRLAELEKIKEDTSQQRTRLQKVETNHIERNYPDYQSLTFTPEVIGWYRASTSTGDPFAQTNLGFLYSKGIGVPQDYARSFELLSQAARSNLAFAQVLLGQLYVAGKGVSASAGEGFKWVERAARQGSVIGQVVLATFYIEGTGVAPSRAEAAKWFKKAADQGNQRAIEELARLQAEESEGVIRTPSGLAFRMEEIPAGTFMMGSPKGEVGRNDAQEDLHQVTISKPFWMGISEVTQEQWQAIMDDNPSAFQDPKRPVERVSWDRIQIFIERLNKQMDDGTIFRLPTEAEWEYACRAGTSGAYAGLPENLAWFAKTADSRTQPVGRKKCNAWGLYDMHGNVYEWCQDRWNPYPLKAVTDPQGGNFGKYRIYRGGSWSGFAQDLRAAARSGGEPSIGADNVGFRLACTRPQSP